MREVGMRGRKGMFVGLGVALVGLLVVAVAHAAAERAACGTSKVVEEISIAKFHTCARLHDGGLACWGLGFGVAPTEITNAGRRCGWR
jgi:hypothetical protein